MSSKFADVPEWPTQSAAPAADRFGIGGNNPPIDERVVMDFVDVLTREGIAERIDRIVSSAGRAPPCTSEAIAGQYGDLVKMARAASADVHAERERLNRPLLTAQRTLKAKADWFEAPMLDAINALRTSLDGFMAAERRKADAARAVAAEEARKLQEAARAAQPTAEFVPIVQAAVVEAPVARGDLGSRVGTKAYWLHKIDSVRQLPDAILKNERVIEALDKVIAAQIRGGARAIKGVTIWEEQKADVR